MLRNSVLSALFVLSCITMTAPSTHAADPALTTIAERSGSTKTGRYDEVIALCNAYAQRYADAVRCIEFGTTPQGRPMQALVVSRTGALTPEAARERGLPVTLIQGGIHAGEIDGKDAGFLADRKSTRLNSSHLVISYAVFCLKK